jgi:hypothetical protein
VILSVMPAVTYSPHFIRKSLRGGVGSGAVRGGGKCTGGVD